MRATYGFGCTSLCMGYAVGAGRPTPPDRLVEGAGGRIFRAVGTPYPAL